MKKIKIVCLLLFSLFLIGCTGKKNIEIFRFVILENTIQVGESVNLQLLLGQYPENSKVTYTLSKKNIIEFEDGVATGIGEGEVDVRATVDNKIFATTKVIVNKVEIEGLQIVSETNIVRYNDTLQLGLKFFPETLSQSVVWSIEKIDGEENDAAEITADGLLIAKRGEKNQEEFDAGGAKVRVLATIESEKIVVKKDFYIRYLETSVLTLDAPDDKTEFLFSELEEVESIKLLTGKVPEDSYPIISFESSDETIVLVDENGILTFPATLKEGQSTITVKTMDGKTATLVIKLVKPVEPEV